MSEKTRNQKIQDWKKENKEQIYIEVRKGVKNELKIIASMHGISVNRLFLDAVSEKYGIEL